MNNRIQTFLNAGIPNDTTLSGIRKVSIGSISLLQMIGNPFSVVMLTGGDLPLNDPTAVLQFIYIHSENLEKVTNEIMRFKIEPEVFTKSCLEFGMRIDTDKLVEIMHDIMNDRDNITNAQTKSISHSTSKSKNEPSQV